MRAVGLALLLLACDAEEGRRPSHPVGYTTAEGTTTAAEESTGATGDETTTTGPDMDDWTTSSGTSTGDHEATTGEDDTTSTSTTTTSDATATGDMGTTTTGTTGEDTTTGTTTGLEVVCECSPEMVEANNVCGAEPTATCEHTQPGGLCDPDGDGVYEDGDWNAGYFAYLEVCG